ncbi:MAG: cyclic nucleotide-binding domain-containing protein [Proteobacteria bacterium]|nr:cyclic nucleotide-binding domain-containing protein [Pseudomonadota bacterium]
MGTAITLEQIITFLLEADMFGDLDPTELSTIVHIMQVQGLRPGQYVFRENDTGDAWYVLYEGEVEVIKDAGEGERVIAVLGPRTCFGEMAILDGSPRSATVRARTDATAFRFPRTEFDDLLKVGTLAAYKLVYQMALVLVSRQRTTTSALVGLLHEDTGPTVREGLEPIVERSTLSE